jgi:hypothetical protein
MPDRYDVWSKFKASPESCVNLFALGQSNTREWLAWRLPLVIANRGLAMSTLEPAGGYPGAGGTTSTGRLSKRLVGPTIPVSGQPPRAVAA